jgi:hypothetical protein
VKVSSEGIQGAVCHYCDDKSAMLLLCHEEHQSP